MDVLNGIAYREIKAEGNRPVLLADVDRVWFVQAGQVDIFITRISDNKPAGARKHLFHSDQGDILLGIEPVKGEETYGLLAVGRTGTILWEVSRQDLLEKTAGAENISKLNTFNVLVERWITKISGSAVGLGKIPAINWEEDLKTKPDALSAWNNVVLDLAVQGFRQEKKEEVALNRLKGKQDKFYMKTGLLKLIGAMNPKLESEWEIKEGLIDSLLFKACTAVGRAKKIKIVPPAGLKDINEALSKDLLGDIARASRTRTREIILKDNWWEKDNGPLLAYREENGYPVALLPLSPTKYELYDPADETRVVVNAAAAGTLKPHAVTFYRSLPPKALNYQDLLKFLSEGIWKRDLAAFLLMGVLGGLLGMLTPVVTGIIFDSVIPDGERLLLIQIGFMLGALTISTFAFNLTRAFAMQRIEGRTEADLQAAVWDRLLSLPVPFFKEYSSGELAGRAMGISRIRALLSGMVINTIISGIFSIFYFFLLFYYSMKLALVSTAVIAGVMGISLLFGYWRMRYERELVDLNNELSGKIFGLLSGISKIKMAGAEKRAFFNWAQLFSRSRAITFKKEHLGNKLEMFNSTINVIGSMIIFYALLNLEDAGLGAGQFIAFNSAFGSFLSAMLQISNVTLQANALVPLYERTKPILETLPEVDEEKREPGELQGGLEVSHVNFRYTDGGPLILNDVTIKVEPGEYVAIVGPSGSGKSTLFRILLGFEKPEAGQVYYDEWDLEKVDIRSVRRQLGVVLQGGQLMPGSIFENIIGANPYLTIDDAWEAARMAGLEEDIKSMPMGMHTMLVEGGGTFSGGQRQRLLIARAIITKPRIIYFDEATSALDNKTQRIVSDSLSGLKATRVVIAHRLSTVIDCDRIIVMERGQVVEEGSYRELFEKGGVFTRMAQRQLA